MGTRATRDRNQADVDTVVDAAVASAVTRNGRPRSPRPELVELLLDRQAEASSVLARALVAAVTSAWRRHWQPADVPRALAHLCGRSHARLAAEAILHEVQAYGLGGLPPRWQAQVDAIDPGTGSLRVDDSGAPDESWAVPAHPLPDKRAEHLVVALQTLAFLRYLPDLPKIGPLPGEPLHRPAAPDASRVDPGVLHRVMSLLAKAESTTFPEEADALTAKAQQLMARHAIDAALLEANRPDQSSGPVASARRVGVDDPYAGAKAILLQTIADANRCRSVWCKDFGFATLFGDETDLDMTELLYTSLLVQSARAMIVASPPGSSRSADTRSFRQSFLVSFASRIGDRLKEAVATAVEDTDDGERTNVLPVLASRAAAADEACRAAFPSVKTKRTTANSFEGWQAGRRAADRAQLELNETIGQGAEPVVGLALQGSG